MNSIQEEILAAIYSVWNRRWVALGITWIVCIVGWLMLALVPNTYESRARIFIQLDDILAEQVGVGVGDRRRDIERVRQTLTSAVNMEKVVRSTGLSEEAKTPMEMESLVAGLIKSVKVVSQEENLFEITATSNRSTLNDAGNAKLAQEIVQKMIDIFREENLSGGRNEMSENLLFINQQLAQREKELEELEQQRTQFEAENPSLARGTVGAGQQLESVRAELRNLDSDLIGAQSALAAINGQLASTPQMLPGVGASGGARGALAQAMSDLSGLQSRGLTDNHPDIIALKNQVESLRRLAASEGGASGVPNPTYGALASSRAERDATVRALSARRMALQGDLARLMADVAGNPEASAEAQRIGRDYDVLRQQYDKLLRDRETLRLRGEVKVDREAVKFEVVDPPTTPQAPIAPKRPILLIGILLAGAAAGIAGAFGLGQIRSTFATAAKLENVTGLPVLGTVSLTLTDTVRGLRRKRMKYFVVGCLLLFCICFLLLVAEFIQRGTLA